MSRFPALNCTAGDDEVVERHVAGGCADNVVANRGIRFAVEWPNSTIAVDVNRREDHVQVAEIPRHVLAVNRPPDVL